ncbi:MAG TPA: SDR family oxidoreductase [Acidimicrobiia bacterium]|nr:SDR family oxidoreductase [Acidimicrobiia bacterium]
MSIENKTVIVTGAASGIGFATAETLAKAGAHVTAVDIAEESLIAGARRLQSTGARIEARIGDVRDLDRLTSIVREVVQNEERIDALVGCAGLADMGSISEGDPTRWMEVLAVNALGPMVSARAVVPYMLQQGHGDIVIVTSASGRITYVGEPAYVASKHAAVAFLDSMRKELAGTDIRVTSIEPGLVDTPMSRSHPFIDTILSSVEPLKPEDIAGLIKVCLTLPARVNINQIVVRPTRQEL